MTRPQVSRLLKRARAEGIVEIRIVDRDTAESPAAEVLRGRFGLDAVHLAPTLAGPEDLTRRIVGRLAAQVLRATIRDGNIVGIGDGASIGAVADALDDAATPVRATVVPLAGGYWSTGPEREPFRRIADAFGAQPHGLMAPGLLDDAATKQALESHAGVRAVVDLWDRLDVALFGIGGRSWGASSVGPEVARDLEDGAAIGEILIAPFDIDGTFVCPTLRDRVLAFDARALGGVPVSIGVGAGERKVGPILGRPPLRDREDTRDRRRTAEAVRRNGRVRDDAGDRDPRHRPRDDRGQGRAWSVWTAGCSPWHARATGSMSARTGWAEQDPAAWWSAVVVAVRALRPPEPVDVVAIGVDGHGPTLAAVDEEAARSTRPAITFLDTRATAEATNSPRPRASAAGRSVRCRPPCGWSAASPMPRRGPAGTSRPGSGWPSG